MMWQTVCLNDVEPTPWRNGGGTTRVLVAWPDSFAWRWRASVAEVLQSGPFSSFAGVQRWFAVLQGDGVCLTINGNAHSLTDADDPLAFDGSLFTTCMLLGGATQDFNLMVQSGVSVRMLRVSGNYQMIANTPKIIAAYAHHEGTSVQIDCETHMLGSASLGWMQVATGTPVQVQGNSALLIEIEL